MPLSTDPNKLPHVKALLNDWGISATDLANGIGLNTKTVSNKFSPSFRDTFSPDQQQAVKEYLKHLRDAVDHLLQDWE
ncbi:hypothetical protein GCM10011383_42430 [Hymenobacter cavernae]|uniref:XRE family transcriptional regulator n=1 Tax=Hymenobacter cavernae TaxID=2044852 RepID=A0ABQ1UUD9_9BACT|nr:hypothetical protein GCM10011383_42430 [Hymenobacter cavernae]